MNARKKENHNYRLGVHTSIAGGIPQSLERAAVLNCSAMQIFSHSPRQWKKTPVSAEEAAQFALLRKQYDINPVYIHASYLINLASHSDDVLAKSIDLLSYELQNADRLGVEYVVLHTGSAQGADGKTARKRAARSILEAVTEGYNASILLENAAGSRGSLTSTVVSLSELLNGCDGQGVSGVCIDTCHAYSAGYDFTTKDGAKNFIDEIEQHIGLDKLKLIHLNDSKKPPGSGVDRHEHIGKGFIGTTGFKNLLSDRRISSVPIILETPKKTEYDDMKNLESVRKILASCGGAKGTRAKKI